LTPFVPNLDRKFLKNCHRCKKRDICPKTLLIFNGGVAFSQIHGKIKELDIKRRGK
jgi:hypothetical protein